MIQSGLSEEQFEAAMKFASNWRDDMEKTNFSWKNRTRGGWASELRRHAYGYVIKVDGHGHHRHVSSQSESANLLFRRVSVRRRIFGIVKEDEVIKVKSDPENDPGCPCLRCTRLEKFGWKNGTAPEMYTLFEFGEIEGQ